MCGVIYGLFHPISGVLRYIGQTRKSPKARLTDHLYVARHTTRPRHVVCWIKSLLQQGLRPVLKVLEVAETQEELDALEKKAISDALAAGVSLTNHDAGGRGAPGRKLSEGHKAKLHSPEARARMATTRRGQPSPRKGVTLSEATRAKISAGKRGNKCRYRTDALTEDMARLRTQGLSFHEVGCRLGVSKTTVRNRLQREA